MDTLVKIILGAEVKDPTQMDLNKSKLLVGSVSGIAGSRGLNSDLGLYHCSSSLVSAFLSVGFLFSVNSDKNKC